MAHTLESALLGAYIALAIVAIAVTWRAYRRTGTLTTAQSVSLIGLLALYGVFQAVGWRWWGWSWSGLPQGLVMVGTAGYFSVQLYRARKADRRRSAKWR